MSNADPPPAFISGVLQVSGAREGGDIAKDKTRDKGQQHEVPTRVMEAIRQPDTGADTYKKNRRQIWTDTSNMPQE
ncbi:hypothetical protein E2C01_063302 [Portunus trituberculatus]|uniref:Uncharacterized protein n=1 Tax=Portunus trituberculatus TaxID=210409 RepID=A0A5B7HIL0_PORTR|nr:hypothetical protein [Portunus trituberculatus]